MHMYSTLHSRTPRINVTALTCERHALDDVKTQFVGERQDEVEHGHVDVDECGEQHPHHRVPRHAQPRQVRVHFTGCNTQKNCCFGCCKQMVSIDRSILQKREMGRMKMMQVQLSQLNRIIDNKQDELASNFSIIYTAS